MQDIPTTLSGTFLDFQLQLDFQQLQCCLAPPLKLEQVATIQFSLKNTQHITKYRKNTVKICMNTSSQRIEKNEIIEIYFMIV